MLLDHLFLDEAYWPVPLILQALAYIGVLRKMDIAWWWALIPGGADYQITRKLYPKTRAFWRPFFVTSLLVACAYYLNPFRGSATVQARIMLHLAIFVYEVFLFRLYLRLSKAFGKSWPFAVLTILLPPLGLSILGYGKSWYLGDPYFEESKAHPVLRLIAGLAFAAVSLVEAGVFVAILLFFTVQAYPPRFLIEAVTGEVLEDTAGVTGTGTVITNEDAAASLPSTAGVREKFFASHEQDKQVVVLEYGLGSDLEDRSGMLSANISQMIDATKQGDGLTFVLECGGSRRWFTKGIEDETYGRYAISGGELTKVQDLPATTCMSEPQELASFLSWAKEAYPADRYILALWDHGGGLSSGYGIDSLNKRAGDQRTIAVNEVVDAVAQSGITFDIIGFDACLMQNIETVVAFEPYADYFLGSEEVEGGFGWSYTSAFGKLAQNPGMPSEEFGREIVACYDPYNTIIKSEPDTQATLSFVDLPLAKAAYQQLEGFFVQAKDAVAADPQNFVSLSLAGSSAYHFSGDEQVDLVDFLERLDVLDYEDKICPKEELLSLVNATKACVVYRNGDSAQGVNGMAMTFPVGSMSSYGDDYRQFNEFSYTAERDLYNDFFSIIAAQKKRQLDELEKTEDPDFLQVLSLALAANYTESEWYVPGFEDYDTTPAPSTVALTEVEGGYLPELPEDAWKIMANTKVAAYQRTDDGLLRSLGTMDSRAVDADGHALVSFDGRWVNVAGRTVCYESGNSRTTDQGIIHTGTVKARLNDSTDIKLNIEWDPVATEEDVPATGRVVGYVTIDPKELEGVFGTLATNNPDLSAILNSRNQEQLRPGDRIDLLFDYYDSDGNLVKTEPYGRTIRVTVAERVMTTTAGVRGDVVFGGVMTDAYQRVVTTEQVTMSRQ